MDRRMFEDLRQFLGRWISPLQARVNSMVTRAVVSLVDDAKLAQELQLRIARNEVLDGVEHAQQAGVSFVPPEGAEVIMLCMGGATAYPVAICAQKREDRPSDEGLEPGEGGLYYAGEFKVFVKANGEVHLGEKDAADFVALAQAVLDELNDIRTTFDAHTHAYTSPGGAAVTTGLTPTMGAAGSVAAAKVKAS